MFYTYKDPTILTPAEAKLVNTAKQLLKENYSLAELQLLMERAYYQLHLIDRKQQIHFIVNDLVVNNITVKRNLDNLGFDQIKNYESVNTYDAEYQNAYYQAKTKEKRRQKLIEKLKKLTGESPEESTLSTTQSTSSEASRDNTGKA